MACMRVCRCMECYEARFQLVRILLLPDMETQIGPIGVVPDTHLHQVPCLFVGGSCVAQGFATCVGGKKRTDTQIDGWMDRWMILKRIARLKEMEKDTEIQTEA